VDLIDVNKVCLVLEINKANLINFKLTVVILIFLISKNIYGSVN